jgi:lipid A ethanolaminephosphotransferase
VFRIKKINAWLAARTQIDMVYLTTIFLMLTGNNALFQGIVIIYPLSFPNLPFLISLAWFFAALTAIFMMIICHGRYARWLIAALVMLASQAAYYMDHYSIIIDTVMIDNIVHTDRSEALGLLSLAMVMQTLLLGILPAWLIFKMTPSTAVSFVTIKLRLRHTILLLLSITMVVAPFTAGYTSFIREHKIARFYANPTYPIYSLIKYAAQTFHAPVSHNIKKVAADAKLIEPPTNKKELIILVVGETARYDRFSLNGYQRPTNPLLAQQNVLSLSNVSSCGTSTGVSVPCMFSNLGREKYDKDQALSQENILDVLTDNGVSVLWRDNNSDSKGVATRVQYEDFKSPTLNTVCDDECRDIGMLGGLDKFIAAHANKDMLIVLHQMGNHGPEYYRRYPKDFERFKPACQTGELRDCTKEEVDNAYDNAILYTDYFLSETINFLKKFDNDYQTAMFYVSDHGESLGEHGLYLHAMPYAISPKEQTRVPAILWLGKNFEYKVKDFLPYKKQAFSHDDLFCGLMTAFEINSGSCKKI